VREALGLLDVQADETLMVGDGLDLDIVAGHAAGVTTALVLTGLTNAEQAQEAAGERKPNLIYPDLTALLRDAQAHAKCVQAERCSIWTHFASTLEYREEILT
jgi:ribonucleotide monophosphatase NagD (HAD superfamily)